MYIHIKDLQNKFHDFIHSITDVGLDFFGALSEGIEAVGGQVLRDAAMAAVLAAEQAGGSGEDKAKSALQAVIATLEHEGLPIVINLAKGAIEAAVAKMRASV